MNVSRIALLALLGWPVYETLPAGEPRAARDIVSVAKGPDSGIRLTQATLDSEPAIPPAPADDEPVLPGPRQFQPSATTSEPPAPQAPSVRRRGRRLARAPNMFGDFPDLVGQAQFQVIRQGDPAILPFFIFQTLGTGDVVPAAGARRLKPAENNNALPQDRVFLMHNVFHNALNTEVRRVELFDAGTGPLIFDSGLRRQEFDIHRYVLGVERSFFDGWLSVMARLPFASRFQVDEEFFETRGGYRGNLNLLMKALLYQSPSLAVAMGTGLDIPTGSDGEGRVDLVTFSIENEAWHVQPFVAALWAPGERVFVNAFFGADLGLNENPIELNTILGSDEIGKFDDQNLLYVDLGGGYWLCRCPGARGVTGVAAILELHYTTTTENTDEVEDFRTIGLDSVSDFTFSRIANRVDALNVTAGFHVELADDVTIRFAGSFPLRTDDFDKAFDAELMTQLNVRW